jgi:hypothetical protein
MPGKSLLAYICNDKTAKRFTSVLFSVKVCILTYIKIPIFELNFLLNNNRLINSMERDYRKSFAIKEENDYIHKMIDMLMGIVTTIGLSVLGKIKKNP